MHDMDRLILLHFHWMTPKAKELGDTKVGCQTAETVHLPNCLDDDTIYQDKELAWTNGRGHIRLSSLEHGVDVLDYRGLGIITSESSGFMDFSIDERCALVPDT